MSKRNELNNLIENPKFWENRKHAEKILKEKKSYDNLLDSHRKSENDIKELYDIFQLANEENDKNLIQETLNKFLELKKEFKKLEIKCFLSNDNDILDSYLEFHAGAGGTESQDWAAMLRRMYMKWAVDRGYNVELISEHKGDEAGIKSSVIKISGQYIYGFLKSESGIHRLVRISPFDSGARRHTSFASVWVYPVVSEDIDVEILDRDLRIDTYRSSGAGGQHVNTTDSAVRITHIPTGISVSQQDEKSQHKNKSKGMKILRSRLYELERSRIEKERSKDRKSKIGTGDRSERIRTYNFPQGRVTDHRINLTLHKLEEFLEGEIFDEMIEALILQAQEETLGTLN